MCTGGTEAEPGRLGSRGDGEEVCARTEYHGGDHCRETPVTNNTGSVEEPAGKRESSHTAAGNGKWYNQFWKKARRFLTKSNTELSYDPQFLC